MSLPNWPVSTEVANGWQMSRPWLAPLATEMDGGNQRLRSKPGSNVATISYPLMPLTDEDYATLMAWFRNTLFNGTSRFNMNVFTGVDYENKVCQFEGGKPPSVTEAARGYKNLTLELRVYGM